MVASRNNQVSSHQIQIVPVLLGAKSSPTLAQVSSDPLSALTTKDNGIEKHELVIDLCMA